MSEVDVSLGSSALSEPASSVGLPDLHPEPDTSVQHGNTISSILHDGLNGCENIGLQTTASLPPVSACSTTLHTCTCTLVNSIVTCCPPLACIRLLADTLPCHVPVKCDRTLLQLACLYL